MQSSDHVERADAEQEGAAPGSTRGDVHDVMSQVSGGRGDRLGSGWRVRVGVVCVCVCVCVCLAKSRSSALIEIFLCGGNERNEAEDFSNSKSKTLQFARKV